MKDKYNNAVGPQVRAEKAGTGKLIPALAVLSMGGGLQAATQFFAHDFRYQAALGASVNHFYAPWSVLQWAGKWYQHYPDAFVRAGSVGVVTSACALLALAITKMVKANTAEPNKYLHGSARWANVKDIRAAGLLAGGFSLRNFSRRKQHGVYVGAWVDESGQQHYLRHNGPEHVLCYAPTRSGKGVGLVLPTLLSWGQSAVIADLKGELWAVTSGWRQKYAKNKVMLFEPGTAGETVAWNPLEEIRVGTEYEWADAQNIAILLVDPNGEGLKSHWQKTAYALCTGLMIHALYKFKLEGTPATMASLDAMMSNPSRPVFELWQEMTTYGHIDGQNHGGIGAAARDMLDRPEEEAGSVLSTLKTAFDLYRDPVVARNTSRSDFRITDLMQDASPVSLYITTQPTDQDRLRPLVRIFLNLMMRKLCGRMAFSDGQAVPNYKHRLLVMLDEFPALGKIPILEQSLAYASGWGIKFYLICQDINQLKSRETGYGQDELITSNCQIQTAFPPNRIETAEHLSRLTGQTTVVKEQITTSGSRFSGLLSQTSRSTQEVQRPLLTPDECLRMPGPVKDSNSENGLILKPGDMVVYVSGRPAIYGKQPLYFKDPVFLARAKIPPPAQTDKVRQALGIQQEDRITL